ncbi:DUF4402 domain-containing protein [Pseudoalteromonas fenneropenaei]|uniref:DUF4402 domain-containing protein n=1 Tax=Pseudoalteromonas fenneropenaei TaxID=1737459 RepID=A0ABV7CGN3_9GAMM
MKKAALTLISLTILSTTSLTATAETKPMKATVTVKNLFTLTPDKELSFGEIRANAELLTDGGKQASLTIPADPDAASGVPTKDGTAVIQSITAGSPATFSVSGTAPNSELLISIPTSAELINSAALPDNPKFVISDFEVLIEGGPNDRQIYDGSSKKLIADNTGAVKFHVGATLKTDPAAKKSTYTDGEYTATVNVTVVY